MLIMLIGNLKIRLSDLIISLSRSLDFVSPQLSNHHLRVAVIAREIARQLGLSKEDIRDIFMAAAIHDLGAFSLREKMNALEFEMKDPLRHAEKGYLLIKDLKIFQQIANIIRYHHMPWSGSDGRGFNGEDMPVGAYILNVSDRIEVLIRKNTEVLSQTEGIINVIKTRAGKDFHPEIVKAFEAAAEKESFWLDAWSSEIEQIVISMDALPVIELDIKELTDIARIFSHIIDYRSPFTAVHSAGVSAVATLLANVIGFSELECLMMRVAGYLHDIGKLAVPIEILEKQDKLSIDEFNTMKSHSYYSYRILGSIDGFETINTWASFHHEKIDGSGYPFRIKGRELPIGSRIMAVADVFTAITEDRPYRKGMRGQDALRLIENMGRSGALDRDVVNVARLNFTQLNELRMDVQLDAGEEYLALKLNDLSF